MANFQTSADLLKGALHEAGEVDNGNSPLQAKALEYLNLSYLNVLSGSNEFDIDCGEPWYWAREEYPANIVLKAPYETDTVVMVKDSADGVFTTAPAASMVGRHLKINDRPDYFIITTHVSGAVDFTMNSVYTDESGTLSFKAIKLLYTLSEDILRFVEPFRVYQNQSRYDSVGKIFSMEMRVFRTQYPLTVLERGVPDYFSISKQDGSTFTVQFNKYVSKDTKVDLDYIKLPAVLTDSAASIPLIPPQHRTILMYMTAALLLNDKDDKKSASMGALTKVKLKAMCKEPAKQEQHASKFRGRIVARKDLFSTSNNSYYYNKY